MASITLDLPEETWRRLEEKAARTGNSLESYLKRVIEADAGPANVTPMGTQPAQFPSETVAAFDRWLAELRSLPPIPYPARRLSDAEFARWRAELKDRQLPPLPPLPGDFSREDIYFDHD